MLIYVKTDEVEHTYSLPLEFKSVHFDFVVKISIQVDNAGLVNHGSVSSSNTRHRDTNQVPQ